MAWEKTLENFVLDDCFGSNQANLKMKSGRGVCVTEDSLQIVYCSTNAFVSIHALKKKNLSNVASWDSNLLCV